MADVVDRPLGRAIPRLTRCTGGGLRKEALAGARRLVFAEDGRGGEIRTHDLYVPNVALYQAKLRPDLISDTHLAMGKKSKGGGGGGSKRKSGNPLLAVFQPEGEAVGAWTRRSSQSAVAATRVESSAMKRESSSGNAARSIGPSTIHWAPLARRFSRAVGAPR